MELSRELRARPWLPGAVPSAAGGVAASLSWSAGCSATGAASPASGLSFAAVLWLSLGFGGFFLGGRVRPRAVQLQFKNIGAFGDREFQAACFLRGVFVGHQRRPHRDAARRQEQRQPRQDRSRRPSPHTYPTAACCDRGRSSFLVRRVKAKLPSFSIVPYAAGPFFSGKKLTVPPGANSPSIVTVPCTVAS